eukprot:CAMPEP_0204393268 /NCGR_PEP_ID=MMETSP0469-20131031/62228_1 /ASSEMBLY_ACC=CAM_ASM_000384 /TAXON_ID=2969 /ORGANISM="Oxyrrhis marina" /LENGTH=383 /DNA_ID=CAMNT_0051387327 /DNA_START=30 /DNA_END=1178 /DNA_ORIENTATION=-
MASKFTAAAIVAALEARTKPRRNPTAPASAPVAPVVPVVLKLALLRGVGRIVHLLLRPLFAAALAAAAWRRRRQPVARAILGGLALWEAVVTVSDPLMQLALGQPAQVAPGMYASPQASSKMKAGLEAVEQLPCTPPWWLRHGDVSTIFCTLQIHPPMPTYTRARIGLENHGPANIDSGLGQDEGGPGGRRKATLHATMVAPARRRQHHFLHIADPPAMPTYTRARIGLENHGPANIDFLVPAGDPRGVVVVVAGVGGDSHAPYVRSFAQATADAGYIAAVMLPRGMGCSDKADTVADLFNPSDVDAVHETVEAVCEALQLPTFLMGFSLGGLVTCNYFARRTPHKLVKGAVALAGGFRTDFMDWGHYLNGYQPIIVSNLVQA